MNPMAATALTLWQRWEAHRGACSCCGPDAPWCWEGMWHYMRASMFVYNGRK